MRGHTRVWETPNKRNPRPAYSVKTGFLRKVPLSYACCERRSKRQMGTHLLCLLPTQNKGKDGKGMEKKRETEHNDLLPKKGNPLNETVCYKIGGTIFEIETSCGGSELLYDKMTRLIKAETVKTPGDKGNDGAL